MTRDRKKNLEKNLSSNGLVVWKVDPSDWMNYKLI